MVIELVRDVRLRQPHMDVAHLRVDVHLAHATGARLACPECGVELSVYDHAEERSWRHLDSCHFQTLLHARPPRVQCPEHGVLRAKLPWAEPGGRFTNLFEALAIAVLLATDVKKAATSAWACSRPTSTPAWRRSPAPKERSCSIAFTSCATSSTRWDMVRKREHKTLLAEGDATLSKSKYLWLYSARTCRTSHANAFDALKSAERVGAEGIAA
ncbi:transposase family protein [Variovorax sp. M-6]|uniref:transposase family protein n=1 Tax=Variovorax sp. M-6 TaxID=3233041 RepID=UPI003F982035